MGLHSTSGYGHRVWYVGPDHYRIAWTHDRHYPSSRLRFPRQMVRDTNEAGALRFVKKWNPLRVPEELKARMLPEPQSAASGNQP